MKVNDQSEAKQLLALRAYRLFAEYRSAYASEWRRLENCERMYRGDHWHDVPVTDPNEPRPVTPVIQSTIENIGAELLDRIPEAVVVPESPDDAEIARVVEAVVRQNHDAASYAAEYRSAVHDLLVGGYAVQEVGYDSALNAGLGGAFIRAVDNRSILFDPLVTDVQDSRAIIKFSRRTLAYMEERFPKDAPYLAADAQQSADAPEDGLLAADRAKSVLLLEFWWRSYDAEEDRSRVHMALLAANRVLADSRDAKPEGYFDHGLYPFLLTRLYPRKGSCLGLGIVDLFEKQQRYADKLDQLVLKNALMASHNKLLVTESSGFDTEDLRDWSKEVHRGESLNGVTWFSTPPLPQYLIGYIQQLREDIKQESGANDFSRGMTTGGITAASAIAALQEMSNKRARVFSRMLHETFRDAVRMEILVEREFNFFTRQVSVQVGGEIKRASFESAMLMRRAEGDARLPIEFCISVRAQQETKFSAMSQNELVLRMLSAGILKPAQAVELMVFDGKDAVLKEMREQERQAQSEASQQQPGAQAPRLSKGGTHEGRTFSH